MVVSKMKLYNNTYLSFIDNRRCRI